MAFKGGRVDGGSSDVRMPFRRRGKSDRLISITTGEHKVIFESFRIEVSSE